MSISIQSTKKKSAKCVLIVDTRERALATDIDRAFADAELDHITQQIAVGDYAIYDPVAGMVRVIIERKSLDDFGQSIKDGRYMNKEKMIAYREKHGNVSLSFVVEGAINPSAKKCFGGIPYGTIESAIFHMSVRDSISTFRTKDTTDTAEFLARFTNSVSSLCERERSMSVVDAIIIGGADAPVPVSVPVSAPVSAPVPVPAPVSAPTNDELHEIKLDAAVATLKVTAETTSEMTALDMWSAISGITSITAPEFAARWSLSEMIMRAGNHSDDLLDGLRRATSGRKYSKQTYDGIRLLGSRAILDGSVATQQARVLEKVRGVTRESAMAIISQSGGLPGLVSKSAAEIAKFALAPGKTGRQRHVGPAVAGRIVAALVAKKV